MRTILVAALTLLLFSASALSQSLIPHIELAFGDNSTEQLSHNTYEVTPTLDIEDAAAVRELARLMNRAYILPGTVIQLNDADGTPLMQGVKAPGTGTVRLESLVPAPRPAPVAPPRSNPPRSQQSTRTWGSECTSYQTGNTTGVRCRDSTGHTWGNECTSYQTGNTFGVRCRDW